MSNCGLFSCSLFSVQKITLLRYTDCMRTHSIPSHETAGNLVSFDGWINSLDKTRTTGWRWRKDGLIKSVNIFGKLYITREEITKFERRALAGEFYKEAITPSTRLTAAKSKPAL